MNPIELEMRLQDHICISFKSCQRQVYYSVLPATPKMRNFWFDGRLDLRKGDVVRILKAIIRGDDVRASRIENVTNGAKVASRIEGVLMTESPIELEEPIVGRITGIEIRSNDVTYFDLEEGVLIDDQVFVPAGESKRGHGVLEQVIRSEIEEYLKVCDPYVSCDTLDLLANSPQGTSILLLTDKIHSPQRFRDCIADLRDRSIDIDVRILKHLMHGRYMLTRGKGWTVDHSLKDFGKKDSLIHRLIGSSLLEENFDRRWAQATVL